MKTPNLNLQNEFDRMEGVFQKNMNVNRRETKLERAEIPNNR